MENTNIENKLLRQEEFIALFPDTRFRYIHDSNKNDIVQGSNILDLSYNKKGFGIFFSVNGFPPSGEAKQANLLSLNANYVDIDIDVSLSQEEKSRILQEMIMSGLEQGTPPPTIINRTQKGVHLFWLYLETLKPTPENITKWRNVQKRLVHCFKGDTNPVDPSRVLRVPYTLHLKDPKNPFEIKIQSYKPEARCTLEELDAKVPKYSNTEIDSSKIPAIQLLLQGVPVGQGLRHKALAQIAGLLLKGASTPEQVETSRLNYYLWDRKIVGSPETFNERKTELDNTFNGIIKREISGNKKELEISSTNRPKIWTTGEILTQDFGEEEWLVESLITKQGMTALSGNPGDFKTWITIHMALCISRNIDVFGKFKTARGNVLIIDEEDHLRLLKKRLNCLGVKDTDNIYYLSQSGIKVDIGAVRDMILEIVKEKNIKLVILDSLIRVHEQDENDAKGMAKVFSSLQKILTAGASILFTHHHRKQNSFGQNNSKQSMRGSSDILAAVDCHIVIEKKRDEEDRLIIRQQKSRQAEELQPFEIKVLKDYIDEKGKACPSGFEYAGGYDEKKKKTEEASEAVIFVLLDGMKSRTELQEALNEEFGKTAIDDGIKLAKEAGKIEQVPKRELDKGDRKAYYRIPKTSNSKNELPTSQLYIEAEKQEDVDHAEDTVDSSAFTF